MSDAPWEPEVPTGEHTPLSRCLICHAVEVVNLQKLEGDERVCSAFVGGMLWGHGIHALDVPSTVARVYEAACEKHKPEFTNIFGHQLVEYLALADSKK